MTSIFDISPNTGILQSEGETQETNQDAIAAHIMENEPITRRYFLICQTCYWCASYIDIMGSMEDLPYEACPTCNDIKIESLPISYNENYLFEYTATRGVVLKFLR